MHAADEQALVELLGIETDATWEEVRRAFRAAVRASHPDLHAGDPDAERRVKSLTALWASINAPEKWSAFVRQPASSGTDGPPGRSERAARASSTRLRVHRQQRGAAGMVNWKLELDGDVVASIENGGIVLLDAEPGRHSLRVFYGTRSCLPLQVQLQRGQELALGCRQIESLRVNLFSPQRCLILERLSDRRPAY